MTRHGERGQVYPLIAMMLVALLGVAALGVDVGYYRYIQRVQQNATDAAAIGAVAENVDIPSYGTAGVVASGKADAALNGFTDGVNGVTITVDPSPAADTFTSTSNGAAKVTITKTYPRFFGAIFGQGTQSITTTAIARLATGSGNCVWLPGNGASNWNGATVTATGCGLVMQTAPNMNGATVTSDTIGYVTGGGNTSGGTFPLATPEATLPLQDPCRWIYGCNYLKNNAPGTTPCPMTVTSNVLQPGCYTSLDVHGNANVTMNPGLYIFYGSTFDFHGATVTGTGVTMYFVGSTTGSNFQSANLTGLTPPTSGNYNGMLMFRPDTTCNASNAPNFNGISGLSGVVYFPECSLNFNSSVGSETVIITNQVNFNGSNQTFSGTGAGANAYGIPSIAE